MRAEGPIKRIINGPVLDAMHWAMGVTTVHPSLHRLKNALGLTVGMMGGRYVMDKAVGQTPDGDPVEREDVPWPLQPLHRSFAYDHFSDKVKDRERRMVDMWLPVGAGAVGAFAGSHDYGLNDQPLVSAAKAVMDNPKALTIEKAESASIVLQGKVWRFLAGATSIFGSSSNIQLIPGPWNYGVSLSESFLGTVPRNKLSTPYAKVVQQFWNGNNHDYAYGPTSMLSRLKDYLVGNTEANPRDTKKMAYAILEPWFGQRVTEQHVDAFVKPLLEARDKVYQPGGVPMAAREELGKTLSDMLSGEVLEKRLVGIDLHPGTAMIGRNGFSEYFAKVIGGEGMLSKLQHTYQEGVKLRHGLKMLPDAAVNAATHAADARVLTGGGMLMGGAVVGLGYLGYNMLGKHAKQAREVAEAEPLKTASDTVLAKDTRHDDVYKAALTASTNKDEAGPGFRAMERVTDMLNAPMTLSMHRTSCALGLSVGGYIGTQLANALTGRTLGGQPLPKNKVPAFVQSLIKSLDMEGKFAYNPQSHAPRDRWMYVMHFLIPATFATAGVIAASDMFFRRRMQSVNSSGKYLDDYENRATMAQANTWTPLTAFSSLFVTPSGFPFLPFPVPNYGTSLGSRFMLASGRKGILPGVGEFWTGSTSRYPLGPVALRDHMMKYATNNSDAHPIQLEEMARGIVLQWFPEASPQQIKTFVKKIEQDRDKFFVPGEGIPEEDKEACQKMLASHFKGAGLEKTLREMGLDPLKATLGSNGFMATVAKYMGAGEDLQEIHKEYAGKYTARLKREQLRDAADTQLQQSI